MPSRSVTPARTVTTDPRLAGLDLNILYAIDSERGTVLLRFLPDTGNNVATDTVALLLLGNKLLLGMEEAPIRTANYAVQKSNVLTGLYNVILIQAMIHQRDLAELAAGNYFGRFITKAGLSRGGMLRLSPNGEEHAIALAADLIRRA